MVTRGVETVRGNGGGAEAARAAGATALALSIVIPCLNEAETIGQCVERALGAIAAAGVEGEVVVADNGSTDGSQEIALALGARVVPVAHRGYGHALAAGIRASRGRFVVMGDADASYDFAEAPRFLAAAEEGYELVQGCRLPPGGGRVEPGAMPVLHRWLGNPVLSLLARWWFRVPVHDVYCGLRGFDRSLIDRLDLRSGGMEYALEMLVRATLVGAPIAEIPITLHPDGRSVRRSHLRTFRDGWRSLRLYLLYSPRWQFLLPGLVAIGLGLVGYALALPGVTVRGITFDAHTLLFASLAILCGSQAVTFAVASKLFGIREGLLPPDPRMAELGRRLPLERGLLLGAIACCAGLVLLLLAVGRWRAAGFGHLDYASTMRLVIPGATLTALGVQGLLASMFWALLGIPKR